MAKRQVEVFTAGCPVCEPAVQTVQGVGLYRLRSRSMTSGRREPTRPRSTASKPCPPWWSMGRWPPAARAAEWTERNFKRPESVGGCPRSGAAGPRFPGLGSVSVHRRRPACGSVNSGNARASARQRSGTTRRSASCPSRRGARPGIGSRGGRREPISRSHFDQYVWHRALAAAGVERSRQNGTLCDISTPPSSSTPASRSKQSPSTSATPIPGSRSGCMRTCSRHPRKEPGPHLIGSLGRPWTAQWPGNACPELCLFWGKPVSVRAPQEQPIPIGTATSVGPRRPVPDLHVPEAPSSPAEVGRPRQPFGVAEEDQRRTGRGCTGRDAGQEVDVVLFGRGMISAGIPAASHFNLGHSAWGKVMPPSPLREVSKRIIVRASSTGSSRQGPPPPGTRRHRKKSPPPRRRSPIRFQPGQTKMSRGRKADTTKLGTSTTSLTFRSTATEQMA